MPKISVIIPVYNVEKYLEQCINSLLSQTLKDCEFIFVNDGSKDSSKEIIEKYKTLDERIILINQENQGVSIARNNGLNVAKGEYIGFVDADDYIEPDMYEILYNNMINNNVDLTICDFESSLDGHRIISNFNLSKNTLLRKDYIESILLKKFFESDELNTVWTKLYKSIIIKSNNIKFPQRVSLGEDGIFNLKYMINTNSLIYVDYTGYHYRETQGSATRNILTNDYFKRALDVYTTNLEEIKNIPIKENEINELKITKFINSVITIIYLYLTPNKTLPLSYRLNYVKKMINNQHVINALPIYIKNTYDSKSRYQKAIIKMIKNRSVLGLYILTIYIWKRNQQNKK